MRIRLAALALLGLATVVSGCGSAGSVKLDNDDQKTWYMVGFMMGGKQAAMLTLTEDQIRYAKEGWGDAAGGKEPKVELQTYGPKVQALMRAKQEEMMKKAQADAAERAEKDKPFRDAAEKETGAVKTASGLIFKSTEEGKGASPKATDWVSVNYAGKLTDGTEFDSTAKHGGQAFKTMVTGRIVPCWQEALQKMKVGGKAHIVCPAEIAYGMRGNGPQIPGGATLQFDLELLSIDEAPKAPAGGPMNLPIHMPPGGAVGKPPATAASTPAVKATAAPAATK